MSIGAKIAALVITFTATPMWLKALQVFEYNDITDTQIFLAFIGSLITKGLIAVLVCGIMRDKAKHKLEVRNHMKEVREEHLDRKKSLIKDRLLEEDEDEFL